MTSRTHSLFARKAVGVSMVLAVGLLLAGCSKPMLSVDDTVQVGQAESPIRVFVEKPRLSATGSKIKDAEVAIFANGREIHRAKTDKDGHIQLHKHLPAGTETFEARTVIDGEEVRAQGRVFQWPKNTIVLVDIDETISQTDYDALLSGDDADVGSTPLPNSVEVLNEIARNYSVLYLTARPRMLLTKTRRWLATEGFPAGPVLTADMFKDIVNQRDYKRRMVAHIRETVPNALVGIGNNQHDADAYGSNGMLTIVIAKDNSESYRVHGVLVRNWSDVRKFFNANAETLRDPERLRKMLAQGGMIQRPLHSWPEAQKIDPAMEKEKN